jgi:hypothetical protein
MTDYKKGKIYRIVCNITGLTYYGSTCEPTLARRLAKHVGDFKHFNDGKTESYTTSFKVIEGGNYVIVLVELFPCDNKMELRQRERFFIEGNECVNKNIPTRTREEWCVLNRNQLKVKQVKYSLENKEKIRLYKVEYALKNKEKIRLYKVEYALKNKEKISKEKKNYKLKNKEKIKTYLTNYYIKNKEARLAKLNLNIIQINGELLTTDKSIGSL